MLQLAGWQIEGTLPDLPKFVLIGAPHTSNWDFVLFLGVIFSLRANVRFMGKAELFRFRLAGSFAIVAAYLWTVKNPPDWWNKW